MIKSFIQYILQRLLGFERYLYVFSLFIIKKLPWDKKEKDFIFFLNKIRDGGIILDIGANIGVMSYHLATKKTKSQIISFEPIPVNYTNMEKIINKFSLSNIQIHKYALGDTEGELEMVLPVVNSVKKHGLSHVVHNSITDFNEGDIFKVPVKKLDELPELMNDTVKINGIKIDIENFEYYALKGGSELIKKHRPVIYAELWDGENRKLTFELLSGLGYSINVVDKGNLSIFNEQDKQNFIFLP